MEKKNEGNRSDHIEYGRTDKTQQHNTHLSPQTHAEMPAHWCFSTTQQKLYRAVAYLHEVRTRG